MAHLVLPRSVARATRLLSPRRSRPGPPGPRSWADPTVEKPDDRDHRQDGDPNDDWPDGDANLEGRASPDPVTRPPGRGYVAAQRGLRGGVIAALAAGPLLGGAALAVAMSVPAPTTSVAVPAASGAGPGTFGAAYVAAWVTAGTTAEGTASSDLAVWGPPAPLAAAAGTHRVSWSQPARAEQLAPGYWSVTVAAEIADLVAGRWQQPALRWFATAVVARGPAAAGGTDPAGSAVAYTATTLPHQVSAPAGLGQPQVVADQTLPASGTAIADTVSTFLRAYLTGSDVSRLISPDTVLSPVTGSGVLSAQLTGLTGDDRASALGAGPVPDTGEAVAVVATVATVDRSGPGNPAAYALTLTARAGRWEIHSLDPAPALPATEPLPTPQSATDPAAG